MGFKGFRISYALGDLIKDFVRIRLLLLIFPRKRPYKKFIFGDFFIPALNKRLPAS
jgi:hypothetical protein